MLWRTRSKLSVSCTALVTSRVFLRATQGIRTGKRTAWNHGAHARTAGIFPMCLLNFFNPEGSLDRHGDFSGPKPFKEQLQIRHEVLRRAAEAEEGGLFARPEEQILGQ